VLPELVGMVVILEVYISVEILVECKILLVSILLFPLFYRSTPVDTAFLWKFWRVDPSVSPSKMEKTESAEEE